MLRSAWRNLLHHGLRLGLSALAIVLGVGFVVGTLIFTDTLGRTFSDLFTDTTSDVVVSPAGGAAGLGQQGPAATVPAAALQAVRATSGAADAAGVVLSDGVTILGRDGTVLGGQGAPRLATNWVDESALTPFRLVDGRGPKAADEVVVDAVSAERGHLAVGDRIRLVGPEGPFSATLVGVLRYGVSGNLAGATIAAFDTERAQGLLLGGREAFSQIDVAAQAGTSQQELASRIRDALGPQVTVQTGAEAADEATAEIAEGLSFVNVFLLIFAAIALFVGTFIILNTFAMLVAQRSREIALLRALGATRGQIVRSLVLESALVGVAGATAGIGVGVAVAFGLQALFGALGAQIPSEGLVLLPRTVAVGLIVGVATTVIAALAPALRAARISPMAALRDDAALSGRSLRVRAAVGAFATAAGVLVLVVGIGQGSPALVGVGALVTFVGVIVVSPALARPMVAVLGAGLPRLFGATGRLAVENAQRQPRRTAATGSALMIGLALVTALTIFAMSAKASINTVIFRVIGAEFVVSNVTPRTPIAASTTTALSAVSGVAEVSPVAALTATVDGQEAPLVGIDPASFSHMIDLTMTAGSLSDLRAGGVAVDTRTAQALQLQAGDPVTLEVGGQPHEYRLDVLYEPAGEFAGFLVDRASLGTGTAPIPDRLVYVKAASGTDLDHLQAALEAAVADDPTVQVQSQAQFAQEITSSVDQILLVMVMLLSLAVLIAVLGIVNTLVLSVTERTREIGMLRAVGALRRQIRTMVVLEALVIAVFGAVVGVVLGVAVATALQRTLADQGITELVIPWLWLVVLVAVAGLVGVVAAAWPAFRAGRLNILRAIATE